MMFLLRNATVVELVDDGFTVVVGGHQKLVLTDLPGRRIRLQAGDVVSVSGAPDASGNWLSSGAQKRLADGTWIPVRISRSSGSTGGQRGRLGIAVHEERESVTVTALAPDSPALAAGLQPCDQIVEIEGKRVGVDRNALYLCRQLEAGESVRLTCRKPSGEERRLVLVAVPEASGQST